MTDNKIIHNPVLLEEILSYLDPEPNQNFIDCTIGTGGHSSEILEKTKPEGKLLGIDLDKNALEICKERLEKFSSRLILIQDNFINLKKIVEKNDFKPTHGILIDLGFSSLQLEEEKGFSFQKDTPLDMHFGELDLKRNASYIINNYRKEELKKIFREYGEEKFSGRIAERIVEARQENPIITTKQLSDLILRTVPKNYYRKIHPATKIFQALRIAVNNELDNLKKVLPQALEILESKGKLIIISFNSLEDRIVKQFFATESKDCICPSEILECRCGHKSQIKILTKKPIIPKEQEIKNNPRSRSAKMRVAEKL